MFTNRIIQFGKKFDGRLEAGLLQGALDYVAYNEEGLAFEILCDHICEFDIFITEDEYQEAVHLITDLRQKGDRQKGDRSIFPALISTLWGEGVV